MKLRFRIRTYTPRDYQALKDIYVEAGMYVDDVDSEERLNRKSKKDPKSLLVAEADGAVIGSVSTVEDDRFAFIFRLVVDKGHRRQGIGSALVAKAESMLRNRGYAVIALMVNEKEPQLLEFYEKQGYKKGVNPHRYMWKR